MPPSPTALPAARPSEVLSYLLTQQAYSTTLIICSQRSTFLAKLQEDIAGRDQENDFSTGPSEASGEEISQQDEEHSDGKLQDAQRAPSHNTTPHPLLTATLHQLSISRHISTVFITSITHLRAYLSIFSTATASTKIPAAPNASFDRKGNKVPLLLVYGLIELHNDTSEWSAQGLGGSLAAAVEAGARTGRKVTLVEPLAAEELREVDEGLNSGQDMDYEGKEDDGAADVDDVKLQSQRAREQAWYGKLPILNGSVRRQFDAYNAGRGDTWVGRTIEVRSVLARWFDFEEPSFWDNGKQF